MKHFEVNNQKYLAVEIPKGCEWCHFPTPNKNQIRVMMFGDFEDEIPAFIDLPKGSWDIVGLVKDMFNDKCKEIVGESTTWYSTELEMSGEGAVPIDHIETSLMKFDKIRTEHNLSDNHLILKQL